MTVATNAQPFISQPTTGNETLSQAQWLEALGRVLPLSQLTVFGAGKGKSTAIEWAAANGVKNVCLIEGNKDQYEHLVAVWQALHPEWQLHNQVMQASANQANTFYTASLPAESGVLAPDALNVLWPNISETQRQPCEPKSLSSWAATHWKSAGQWVFIDYFCEADLLNACQDAFKNVDVLMIRVSTAEQSPKALSAKAWTTALEKTGFSVVHRKEERHPHIEHWLCIRSPSEERRILKQQLEEIYQQDKQQAQQQLEDKQAQLTRQQAQFKQLSEERDTLKNRLNKALKASQQHQQAQKETAEKLEQANQQLKTTQQKLEAAEGNYQQAEKQRQEIEKAHQELQHKLEETHGWFLSRKQQAEEGAEKIATLQGELHTKAEQAANLEERLKATEAEREKYNGYFADRKKQHEEAKVQLRDAQQALKERDATISQLSEQLDALQQSNERFAQLEGKLEALFGEQKTYIQQTTNALGQHVTRSARQQRDEQALTHYLQHGQRPVSTQLPPGYAMALLEHYETTQHDVVVVLGSSETTELLAQAILNTRQQQRRLSGGQREQQDNEVTLSNADLPQAVVSIEHQKAASEALKQRLGNKTLAQAVSVVYAPWVECQANGQSALFYAADATLQRLNQWLPDDARVLVIVGEALPDASHSREVTLPVLLQQLPTQRLDIVLEGSSQPQETNLQENWNKLLENRQRPGHWLNLPNTQSLRVEG
ncbi:hypothetical protein HLB35_07285 [Halomonas sp. TBZ9]|uniref:Uncharacterized protein n=1 Tax=Vreelandella azerica TaxID=2732867 RepID=A0A7Y3XAV4_9GAMM|nr:hypothetical protein [Halomonas azerica]NOG31620.1 hypothetical protein [Halomonas azerica]